MMEWTALTDCTPKYDGVYEVKTDKERVLLATYEVTGYGGHWGRLLDDDLRDDRARENYTHWRKA